MKSQLGVYGDSGLADEMQGPVIKLNECIGMVSCSFALISSGFDWRFATKS